MCGPRHTYIYIYIHIHISKHRDGVDTRRVHLLGLLSRASLPKRDRSSRLTASGGADEHDRIRERKALLAKYRVRLRIPSVAAAGALPASFDRRRTRVRHPAVTAMRVVLHGAIDLARTYVTFCKGISFQARCDEVHVEMEGATKFLARSDDRKRVLRVSYESV